MQAFVLGVAAKMEMKIIFAATFTFADRDA